METLNTLNKRYLVIKVGKFVEAVLNTIKVQIIIGRISSRKDGSLSLSAETPELTNPEKVALMGLQGQVIEATLAPLYDKTELLEVDREVRSKTQSQRIRNVLFVYWQQKGEPGDFRGFYEKETDKYIQAIKDHLE